MQQADESARVRWRRVEASVVPLLLQYALQQWGKEFLLEAWDEFFLWDAIPDDMTEAPEFDTVFLPWLIFHYVPDPQHPDAAPTLNWPTESVGQHYLRLHPAALDADERRFIERAAESPYSFFSVTEVNPGRDMHLFDVLTGRTLRVSERSASEMVRPGVILYASVLSFDEVAILCGAAPLVLPPICRNSIIDLRKSLRKGRHWTSAELVAGALEIRDLYHALAESLRDPAPPRITNTDGDPLEPTTLDFEMRCSPQEAYERLKPLTLSEDDSDLLDAERDADGTLRVANVTWLKKGNRQQRSWDNTVLGHIRIEPGRLTAEVNSTRRAARLKKELAKRLGDQIVFTGATVADLDALLKSGPPASNEGIEDSPEIREILAQHAAHHWEEWLDMRVPALGNKTPRQAARTELGRERLEALLADFAWRDEKQPAHLRADLAWLRQQLGL